MTDKSPESLNDCKVEFEKWYPIRRKEWLSVGVKLSEEDANSMWDGWKAAWELQEARVQGCLV
jgi:hypothetical protein